MTARRRVVLVLTEGEAKALAEVASQGLEGYRGVPADQWAHGRGEMACAERADQKLARARRNPVTADVVLTMSTAEADMLTDWAGEGECGAEQDHVPMGNLNPAQAQAGYRAMERLRTGLAQAKGEL